QDSAAEAIVAQALSTVDFPAVIEAAYADGVRLFLEIGPGSSCTRMIGQILAGRPHLARATCLAGADNVSSVLRLLAQLLAERVPLDLSTLYDSSLDGAKPAGKSLTIAVGAPAFRTVNAPRPFGTPIDEPVLVPADAGPQSEPQVEVDSPLL